MWSNPSLKATTFSITSWLLQNPILSKCYLSWTWQSSGWTYGMSKAVVKPKDSLTDVSI